jgi:hypothetical protein
MLPTCQNRQQMVVKIYIVSQQNSPAKPSFLAISPTLDPLSWFSLDTMVSAGWDTTAQNTPAAGKTNLCQYLSNAQSKRKPQHVITTRTSSTFKQKLDVLRFLKSESSIVIQKPCKELDLPPRVEGKKLSSFNCQ